MICVDSNIWIYYLDGSLPEHPRVAPAVRREIREGTVLLNRVVQMEVAHHLVRSLGPAAGKEKLDAFLRAPFQVDDIDGGLVASAVDILQRHAPVGIGGRDATLLATMKRHGADRLMTHDRALKRVEWVKAVDPCERR